MLVAINLRPEDPKEEIDAVLEHCKNIKIDVVVSDMWRKGGSGGTELAKKAAKMAEVPSKFKYLYESDLPVAEKIEAIAKKIYGAGGVVFTKGADHDIVELEKNGYSSLPICMAKTQYSLSDDPNLLGAPKGFNITVKRLRVSAGAGFIVAFTGDIMTMPGLPKHPAAENMDISENGKIKGLF